MQYDFNNGKIFDEFKIKLGTADLPRFSCAAHKANIAVRMAISCNQTLLNIIKQLNKYSSAVRASIKLSKSHIQARTKLLYDNKTRWSSTFIMFDSFKRSYQNNAFSPEFPCPINLEAIETYMQIFQPAYLFTLIVQKTSSTIGEIVPLLNIMISKWQRAIVNGNYKVISENLIRTFKRKFDYELKSPIYLVACIFNTSKIGLWIKRKDCLYILLDGLKQIPNVFKDFEKASKKNTPNINQRSFSSNKENDDAMSSFLNDQSYENEQPTQISNDLKIAAEVVIFEKLIEEEKYENISTGYLI